MKWGIRLAYRTPAGPTSVGGYKGWPGKPSSVFNPRIKGKGLAQQKELPQTELAH